MSDMTIQDFCDLHGACSDGRDWAMAHCQTMADVWAKVRPEWLIWIATRRGVLTDRELRLFAVSSARRVQHLMTDPRSVESLDVAERHANGEATDEELAAAWAAAGDAAWDAARAAARAAAWDAARAAARAAAWDAARDAARAAAWDAARDAARDAAWAAAGDAAWDAARDAARDAAWAAAGDAAWAAARDAARAAQAEWLRANTTPNFQAKEEGR